MADEKKLLETFQAELSILSDKLRVSGCTSLARCKEGARRDFLAKEFVKKFSGVTLPDFDATIYDYMTGDRPNARDVQTILQVLIETDNETSIDTVLESIDMRVGGGFASKSRSPSQRQAALADAWWGDSILEPFERAFAKKKKFRNRVNELITEFRNHTKTATEQSV
jgi:hypothetical protein